MYDFAENTAPAVQKKVLALHDLSCFGRSSLVPITAILSVLGHQCVPLPTAVFSTHTAIPGWVCRDLTDSLHPMLAHFGSLDLRFESVYSGFLGSADQIDRVAEAASLKTPDGLFLVDPVMGDNGAVYTTYTPEMTARMSELCALADLITPNVTEAAILLGKQPDTIVRDRAEAEAWALELGGRYQAQVVLTGLNLHPGKLTVACCAGDKTEFVEHDCIDGFFPGTGDIFASVLLGDLLGGSALTDSAARAAAFVRSCIAFTVSRNADPMRGVLFEPLLGQLLRPLGA